MSDDYDDNYCEECDAIFDGRICPGCPTEAQLIEQRDFYKLVSRVFYAHRGGGEATKAHHLAKLARTCFDAGRASTSVPPPKKSDP
jgi:hypothetical protein